MGDRRVRETVRERLFFESSSLRNQLESGSNFRTSDLLCVMIRRSIEMISGYMDHKALSSCRSYVEARGIIQSMIHSGRQPGMHAHPLHHYKSYISHKRGRSCRQYLLPRPLCRPVIATPPGLPILPYSLGRHDGSRPRASGA